MPHRHGQRGVGSGLRGEPFVGELRVVRIVRADRDHLGAAVPHLGHPVRVRGAGDGDVGAPHHQIPGVPPVPRFRDVGLVPEHLRAGHGEVGVPVVEGRHHPADQLDEAGPHGVRDHGHRRDGREAGAAVRAVGLDGVHVRGGGDFDRLLPGDPHQAALAAGLLVAAAPLGVAHDVGKGQHRVTQPGLGLAVHLDEDAPRIRKTHPGGRIGVPGEGRAARAAPRLVFRAVRAHGGVVGLLGFPGDDAVLDVHLPGAGAGAVHPVRGPDHLVVAPAVPVEDVALAATLAEHRPAVVGLVPFRKESAQLQHCIRGGPVQPRRVSGSHSFKLGCPFWPEQGLRTLWQPRVRAARELPGRPRSSGPAGQGQRVRRSSPARRRQPPAPHGSRSPWQRSRGCRRGGTATAARSGARCRRRPRFRPWWRA